MTTIVVVLLPFFTESTLLVRVVRSGLAVMLIAAVWHLSRGRLIPYFVLLIVMLDLLAQWLVLEQQSPALIVARNILSLVFLTTAAFEGVKQREGEQAGSSGWWVLRLAW